MRVKGCHKINPHWEKGLTHYWTIPFTRSHQVGKSLYLIKLSSFVHFFSKIVFYPIGGPFFIFRRTGG